MKYKCQKCQHEGDTDTAPASDGKFFCHGCGHHIGGYCKTSAVGPPGSADIAGGAGGAATVRFQPLGFADGQAWARAILSVNWEKNRPLQSTLDSLIEIGRRSDCYPDLLEACQAAAAAVSLRLGTPIEPEWLRPMLKAIEKATGKEVKDA